MPTRKISFATKNADNIDTMTHDLQNMSKTNLERERRSGTTSERFSKMLSKVK
jgi:hypothetical protein